MKRTIGILDLIIFLLSIIVLLIAFFMNMDKLSLLIGVGLIILLGIAHTRLEKITGLSSENPKIKTMRRMNRLSMVFVVILYLIPFGIIILMFLVSAIMLFFLPSEIDILHSGDTNYPIPSVLGVWLVPIIALLLNFSFIKQKRLSSLNSIIMALLLVGSTIYYFTLM